MPSTPDIITAYKECHLAKLSFSATLLLLSIQDAALNGADVDAQAYLAAEHTFIKNNDAVDRVLIANGTEFTFVTATSYCLTKEEAPFFIAKAIEKGFLLEFVDLTEWLATGVVLTFLS